MKKPPVTAGGFFFREEIYKVDMTTSVFVFSDLSFRR
jgi:hypothetical protein